MDKSATSDAPPAVRAAEPESPPTAPARPLSASRIDALTEEFAALLSRRPPDVGQILAGHYRIVEALGEGGMGHVFIAENLAIRRRVAIKVLRAELLADLSFRRRFQQEAEAVAAVEHPNVVRVFDIVVGDPTFLVMEYVPGPTLAAELKRDRRLDPERAIRIAQRLCSGLHAAHRAGVVHRDLKPANIILAPDEELGENPKLVDFGVAKMIGVKPAEEQLTRSGQLVGTPHYMSPEQITDNNLVDARSDVYSLGCVLYHMLAGQPPFPADEEFQILSQHVNQLATPPSRHASGLSPELDAIVLRALAKRPAARFASAAEMAEALARAGAGRTIGDPALPARPRRIRIGLTLALLAGVALLGAGLTLGRQTAPRAPTGGAILIGSDPLGADVELDGQLLTQKTPTLATGLSSGKHVVLVRHQAFDAVEQVITVDAQKPQMIAPALPPKSRSLEIRTVPEGAMVFIDDHPVVGQTPLTISVAENDFHQLRLDRSGYKPFIKALKPEEREAVLTVQLEAETQARGTVWVDADRPAYVFLDDIETGLLTPTLGIRADIGDHTIELRDGTGHVGARAKIHIARGDTLHLTLVFKNDATK